LGEHDDPFQAETVRGIGDQFQIGKDILDLFPLIELQPAYDRIRDLLFNQFILEGTGLGVDPVEDGDLAVGPKRFGRRMR